MNKDKQIKTLMKRNAELSAENERLNKIVSQYEESSVKQLVMKLQFLEKEYNSLIADLRVKAAAIDEVSKDIHNTGTQLSIFRNECESYRHELQGSGKVITAK